MTEWASRQAHLNEVANFLMESTDPETSRSLERELLKLNADWAQFVHRNTLVGIREELPREARSRHKRCQPGIPKLKRLLLLHFCKALA